MQGMRAEAIAEELEGLIVTGDLAHGTRLNEARLAERFGVSRTPVREAVQRLSQSGLVEQIPHRGAFIRQPDPLELLEMFEVMAELEAFCGQLAARRISDAALDGLRRANAACAAMVEAGDPDAYYRETEIFHQTIYREAGNRFLERQTLQLSRRLKPFRRAQLRLRGRMKRSLSEHAGIIEELAAGDGRAVADRMRAHVAVQGDHARDLLAGLADRV